MPVVEALNHKKREASWRTSHDWSIHLLSFICTKTLLQGATDRDAGLVKDFLDPDQARNSHRFDAHLRSKDGRFVVKLSTMGPPYKKKVGDYTVLSVYNTEYADTLRNNRPLAVLDTVILPWYDTRTMPHLASTDFLMHEQPVALNSLRDMLAEATQIDLQHYESTVDSPVSVTEEVA